MTKTAIKTYTTESFRTKYIASERPLDALLKTDFGKFFIVKVEDMLRLMKLPIPPVRSTTHTLIFLTEGEAVMNIGSSTYTIHKDECLAVPAGQVFSFSNFDVNKGYLCNFHNDILIGKFGKNELLNEFEFLHIWGNPRIPLGPKTGEFVLPLFKRLLLDYSENGLKNYDLIQSYFMALLCEINSAYRSVFHSTPVQAVKITKRFKELLFSEIRTNHSVAEYASLLHITPNHLNKTIKAVTGKSPTDWIDEAVILEAKVLLYQSSFSIQEVATEVGFADPSYFSRFFRKKEGITPVQFRKMIEKS